MSAVIPIFSSQFQSPLAGRGETCSHRGLRNSFCPKYAYVTLYKKTRHKSQLAVGHNAHLKVKSLFCFLLKVKFTNGDKVKTVRDNAVLSSALYSAVCILISSVKASFSPKRPVLKIRAKLWRKILIGGRG